MTENSQKKNSSNSIVCHTPQGDDLKSRSSYKIATDNGKPVTGGDNAATCNADSTTSHDETSASSGETATSNVKVAASNGESTTSTGETPSGYVQVATTNVTIAASNVETAVRNGGDGKTATNNGSNGKALNDSRQVTIGRNHIFTSIESNFKDLEKSKISGIFSKPVQADANANTVKTNSESIAAARRM